MYILRSFHRTSWKTYGGYRPNDAATRLVVTNTSSVGLTAAVAVDGTSPEQQAPLQITLNPWETRVLDIMRDVVGAPNGSLERKGGISITHSGSPGGMLARMFIARPNRGYSAVAGFIDPEATNSQKWNGGGLRLKNIDGSDLRPLLVARNTAVGRARLRGRVIYTKPNGEMAEVVIPMTQIPARSTRIINLAALIDDANVPASVYVGGVELEYDAPKGTVLTSTQSTSPDDQHVFLVPMYDPQRMPSSAGGFPWKADRDYRTLVYIKNETAVTRRYAASLVYPGGGYTLRPAEIRPGETVVVDFKKLRDEQTPDSLGNLIPLNLEKAQIGWSARGGENNVLSGRSEQISLSEGVASTYACYNCCSDVFVTGWIEPYSATIGIGSSLVYTGKEIYANCYLQEYSPNWAIGVSWLSFNSSIATINSFSGDAQGIATGNTWIEGSWTADQWLNTNGYCQYSPVPVAPQEPVEVPPCAYPVNFRQDSSGVDIGNGRLRFIYKWDSSDGNLSSLNLCEVGEIVTYPGTGDYIPPRPPFPNIGFTNPTVINIPGTAGQFQDTHNTDGTFTTPYSSASFTATQYYRYRCGCISQGNYVNLVGPLSIVRSVSPATGTQWKFTITKSGDSATINPLP